MRKILLLMLTMPGVVHMANAQENEFCSAVNAIVQDAPSQFKNIRGKMISSDMTATTWASGISVPGTIGSRFVQSMGLFYEGAFFQTFNKEDVRAVYGRYKGLLKDCLEQQGYTMSAQDNFYPGMAEYKKLVFMQEPKDDTLSEAPPPHIALEADYSKDSHKYTVVLFIFQH